MSDSAWPVAYTIRASIKIEKNEANKAKYRQNNLNAEIFKMKQNILKDPITIVERQP